MSYINQILMKEEHIIYTARIHWMIFFPSVVLILLALPQLKLAKVEDGSPLGWIFLLSIGIVWFICALLIRKTTELGITNKRIIGKTGILMRNTLELNQSKVESVTVQQGILGRVFGYGTINIRGTGGSTMPLRYLENPLTFRKNISQIAI